jgi:formylglycine-generating enzyme required for sulfatase activity
MSQYASTNAETKNYEILSDLPTTNDSLDFEPYVNSLKRIIRSQNTSTPLTIGVFGTWGSGKTSLMKMIQKGISDFPTVWFDAWKFEKEDALWRALIIQILRVVRAEIEKTGEKQGETLSRLDDLEASLYRVVQREELGNLQINWSELLKGSVETAVQVGLALIPGLHIVQAVREGIGTKAGEKSPGNILRAVERAKTQIYLEQIRSIEQFQSVFQDIISANIVETQKLVIFIDDLDRCEPQKALLVLEAIKLFLDVPGCLFVLGLDQDVIARSIELKYRELGFGQVDFNPRKPVINGAKYLEKIIQLPFQIPPIEQEDMASFINELVSKWPDKACPDVFAAGLGNNPRQVKRTINVFLLIWSLAQERAKRLKGGVKPVRLAKVVVIQNTYQELYEVLKRNPRLLRDLEEYHRKVVSIQSLETPEAKSQNERESQVSYPQPPPALREYVDRQTIRRILTMHPIETKDVNFTGLTPDELRLYFTLARRAESPNLTRYDFPYKSFEPEMIPIPSDKFLMGSSDIQIENAIKKGLDSKFARAEGPQQEIYLSDYKISKYLITNIEYQSYILDTGQRPPNHWNNGEPPPEELDHPVTNIYWNDAVSYCKWLSQKTGVQCRLPTEAEWEKAARGTDGNLYPWGDEFDTNNCNSQLSKIGKTTPVGQYSPRGDSPYECADMAGNVWEWTNSWFAPYDGSAYRHEDFGEKFKVVRGGSWNEKAVLMRCSVRAREALDTKSGNLGFRVVSTNGSVDNKA